MKKEKIQSNRNNAKRPEITPDEILLSLNSDSNIRAFTDNEALIIERRTHIIKHALKVFLDKGYQATRMKDISKATGMPEGTIYRYIGTKDDLLHLIVLSRTLGIINLEKKVASFLEDNPKATFTQLLVALLRHQIITSDESRNFNLFFNREIRYFKDADRRKLIDSQVELINYFKDLIEKGIAAGEFRVKSALAVAHNILIISHDWGLRYWFLSRYFTVEEYTDIQTDLVLKQLQTSSTSG